MFPTNDVWFVLTSICRGFMFYPCYLYLFTYTGVQHDVHIRWWSCRLTGTRRVSRVKQQWLTLPEHLSLPPGYSGVRFARSLIFCVMFCKSLFVLYLLAIVLFVLRFMASDYSFGFFKLFLVMLFNAKWAMLCNIMTRTCWILIKRNMISGLYCSNVLLQTTSNNVPPSRCVSGSDITIKYHLNRSCFGLPDCVLNRTY